MGRDSDFQKPITGSITAVSQTIDLTSPNQSTSIIQLAGTWAGTLVVEGSNDNSTYYIIPALESSASNLPITGMTANGVYVAQTNGYQYIRLRSSLWTSGTGTVTVYGSDAASLISTISVIRGGSDGTIVGNALDRLKVIDGLRNGGVHGSLTLTTGGTTYEAKVGGSRLANRKSLTITALDDMFWGYDNTVTTSSGTPLYKNQQIIFAIDPDSTFQVWLVASANSKVARIAESL